MNTFILSGSHRRSGATHKVSQYIQGALARRGNEATVFSLAGNPLPLWSEGVQDDTSVSELWRSTSERLALSDSIVIATPEWNGMVTPGVKNFLLFLEGELRHKPGLIVTISSAAANGAYSVAELRGVSSKNNQLCFIPEHVIVRSVEHVLNEECPQTADDRRVRERFEYAFDMLEAYAGALAAVRNNARLGTCAERFQYGM